MSFVDVAKIKNENRAYTREEVRALFLTKVATIAEYWGEVAKTPQEAADGAVFSILSLLDGCSMFPKFQVVPEPHPTDRDFHVSKGENYYPESPVLPCDIAGSLHELFGNYKG